MSREQTAATQRLHRVNDFQRQRKKKVLVFCLLGASVECFVKVHIHVHSMSNDICDMLMPHLWWQKAPMWFLFVNPPLHLLKAECSVYWKWQCQCLLWYCIYHIEKTEPWCPKCWEYLLSQVPHHTINNLPFISCRVYTCRCSRSTGWRVLVGRWIVWKSRIFCIPCVSWIDLITDHLWYPSWSVYQIQIR